MEPDRTVFGDALRRMRLAAALSQEGLAERAGLSARAISDLERGVRQRPRPESLRLLADALGLTGRDRERFIAAAMPEPQSGTERDSSGRTVAVPQPVTPLLGRAQEQATLAAMLSGQEARLVTLTGMGGIGKTRLAIEIANEVCEAFADGVVFVDLAPLSDPALVISTIAAALNIRASDDRPIVKAIIAALRDKHLLVLLDNCEQVLEATTDIAEVLVACPGLTVLATSREALRLRGEQEWPVLPLPLPDLTRLPPLSELSKSPAVALFLSRAEASDPRFALTAENARAVATICHRVDGIPLGIELAAARVKLLPPEVLAVRLEQRLPLLTRGARDAPTRQRTLRNALAWSYDLLTHEEQTLFCRLGVFVGGWTIEAAEVVANPDDALSVLDGLGSLLDKSLIRIAQQTPNVRYGMLETMREFALDQLNRSGEGDATRERHATYFLELAQRGAVELEGSNQRGWRTLLEREYANLRAALATLDARGDEERHLGLTTALTWYWYEHAPASEGLAHFERVLARKSATIPDRLRTLLGAGMLLYTSGAYANAERWLQEGEELARAVDDTTFLAHFALTRGAIAEHVGDETRAQAFFETGLALAQDAGNAWLISEGLTNLSDAAYRRGELDLAEQFALDAVPALRDSGNVFVETMNFVNIAQIALARGEIQQAVEAFEEALHIAEESERRWSAIDIIAGAAAVSAALGRHRRAVQLLAVADEERERSGKSRLPHFGLFAQTHEAVRRNLDVEAFQDGWAMGRRFSIEEAIAEARTVFTEARVATAPAYSPPGSPNSPGGARPRRPRAPHRSPGQAGHR